MPNYTVRHFGPNWLRKNRFPFLSKLMRGWHSWELQVGPHILMWSHPGETWSEQHFRIGRFHYSRDTHWRK